MATRQFLSAVAFRITRSSLSLIFKSIAVTADTLEKEQIRLTDPVSIHLLIHLSTHPYHHRHSHHSSLLHSFTLGSKPTFSTNPSHLNFSSLLIGLSS